MKKIWNNIKNSVLKGLRSWITTVLGATVGGAMMLPTLMALLDQDPETVFVFKDLLPGLGILLLGLFTRDGDKTSEDVAGTVVKEGVKDKIEEKIEDKVGKLKSEVLSRIENISDKIEKK